MIRSLAILAILALVVGAAVPACAKESDKSVPLGELSLGESPRVITGPVGAGVKERQASYVLIDVTNRGSKDAVVTVRGTLTGKAQSTVLPLRSETLRIPAGQTRMFALVDDELEPREVVEPTASVEVAKATRVGIPAGAIVTSPAVHLDQGRAVIEGIVENRTRQRASVVVLGAFYDEAGRPVMRRTTVYKLDKDGSRSAQFVGPRGSATGQIFIGDIGP